MNILFITATRIGDAVLSSGLLKHISDTYPDARLTIACGPIAADLFRAAPNLERLVLIKKQKHNKHWLDFWRACHKTKWDLIIDLRNSLATRFLCGKKKYYMKPNRAPLHKVEQYAGILDLTPPPAPFLWTDKVAETKAEELTRGVEKILALGPAANWLPKQWPTPFFAELAQKLTKEGAPLAGAKIMICAAPHERESLEPLFRALPKKQIIDTIGEDLTTIAACLGHATLFIGNDSGLTHMATSMKTPTLALFGPGCEAIYGPWGENTAVVRGPTSRDELLKQLEKSDGCATSLMENLSVISVYEAAENLINSAPSIS